MFQALVRLVFLSRPIAKQPNNQPTNKEGTIQRRSKFVFGILVCVGEFEALPGASVDMNAAHFQVPGRANGGGTSKVHTCIFQAPPPLMNGGLTTF